jgi:N-acetylglucosaminyl-diphospho-decaprenol L-rhamnosyltransferase
LNFAHFPLVVSYVKAERRTGISVKLLVVIVNYRVAHLTIDCLRSVAEELPRIDGTQVVVCENGTGDDSAEKIQSAIQLNGWTDWCTLTVLKTNLGFTGGNNAVLRPALKSEHPPNYVLLLNADTIVRPNALKALLDFMDQNPSVGIAGSRLEEPDGTPQCSAFRFLSPLGELAGYIAIGPMTRLLHRWFVAPPVVDHPIETDWVSGASMIIRRKVFQDVGVLDEGYYTYFDDIDYCFNARKHGWPTWYVPESRVVHLVGQTTGVKINREAKRIPSYVLDARRRYLLKNYGPVYAGLTDAGMIVGLLFNQLYRSIAGKLDSTPPNKLGDAVRHSVFIKGFRLNEVPNPALPAPRA